MSFHTVPDIIPEFQTNCSVSGLLCKPLNKAFSLGAYPYILWHKDVSWSSVRQSCKIPATKTGKCYRPSWEEYLAYICHTVRKNEQSIYSLKVIYKQDCFQPSWSTSKLFVACHDVLSRQNNPSYNSSCIGQDGKIPPTEGCLTEYSILLLLFSLITYSFKKPVLTELKL